MTCPETEARFTSPHEACPNPTWWHAPDSESTEVEVSELIGALVRAIQPEYVIETGTAFGYTTAAIAGALERNGHGRLVTLEIDQERLQQAIGRVAEVAGLPASVRVDFRLMSSLEFTPEHPIGFALFDSLYELRAREFRRYHPWMLPGTICAFHDWTSGLRGHYMDVRASIEELRMEGLLAPVYVPTPRGLAICEVLP